MTSTRVCQAMEIAPFTVIPYKPKPQQPFSRNVHKLRPKPLVKRPSSLFASQAIDLEAWTKTLLDEDDLLEKEASHFKVTTRHAGSTGDELGSGRGMLSDLLSSRNPRLIIPS